MPFRRATHRLYSTAQIAHKKTKHFVTEALGGTAANMLRKAVSQLTRPKLLLGMYHTIRAHTLVTTARHYIHGL
jgi:hypothetical protein